MDLKFTFVGKNDGHTHDTPAQQHDTHAPQLNPGSSALYIRVRRTAELFEAAGVSGDEVRYAYSKRVLKTGEEPEKALRSVISTVVAELDEPLNQMITELQLQHDLFILLIALGGIDTPDSNTGLTTSQLQLRTGIQAGTPVTVAETIDIPAK